MVIFIVHFEKYFSYSVYIGQLIEECGENGSFGKISFQHGYFNAASFPEEMCRLAFLAQT